MEIGKNIAKFRKEKNLTQEELAKKLCVSPKTLSSYENNRNLPNIEMLILLSDTLGVSINDLLGSKNEALDKYQKHHTKNILIVLLICILSCIYFMLSEYMFIGSMTYLKEVKDAFDNNLRTDLYVLIIKSGFWYILISLDLYLSYYVSHKKIKNYQIYQILFCILTVIIIIVSIFI